MSEILQRMLDEGRPADEISLVADGMALRWLLDNCTVQPDDRGEWSLVYVYTETVPLNRNQALSVLRKQAGIAL